MKGNERRRAKRLRANDNLLVAFGCDMAVIGRINNISQLGVSVEYEEASWEIDLKQKLFIKIFNERRPTMPADKIQCNVVYNIATLAHDNSFLGKKMRLMGMQFAKMSTSERNRINQMLMKDSSRP